MHGIEGCLGWPRHVVRVVLPAEEGRAQDIYDWTNGMPK